MKKILLVDDEKKIRDIYAKLLADEGFSVIEAKNAPDANDILKNEKIDLILLDIKIPEIEGDILYEVIQMFYKEIKVIVTSVYPIEEQKQIIREAADYYDKSQALEILLSKIKSVLNNGQADTGAH